MGEPQHQASVSGSSVSPHKELSPALKWKPSWPFPLPQTFLLGSDRQGISSFSSLLEGAAGTYAKFQVGDLTGDTHEPAPSRETWYMLQRKQNQSCLSWLSLLACFLWAGFGSLPSLPGHCATLPLEELLSICHHSHSLLCLLDPSPAYSSLLLTYLSLHLLYSGPPASRSLHMLFHPPERLFLPSIWLTPSHTSCLHIRTTSRGRLP